MMGSVLTPREEEGFRMGYEKMKPWTKKRDTAMPEGKRDNDDNLIQMEKSQHISIINRSITSPTNAMWRKRNM